MLARPPADTSKTDYWLRAEDLIDANIGSRAELAIRYSVIFSGMVSMFAATGDLLIVALLSAFLLLNGYFSYLLWRLSAPVSKSRYVWLCTLLTVSATCYSTCALYMFSFEQVALKVIAVCSFVAQSLFNISRHRNWSFMLLWDTCLVVIGGIYFGLNHLTMANTLAEQGVIAIATIGTCMYLIIAQLRSVQTYIDLKQVREEAIQTQKMRAIGQLTAGVAHDFNNILTVIRGNTELAEICESAQERNAHLTEVIEASDRAAELTGQLLSFSRKARLRAGLIDLPDCWSNFGAALTRVLPATIETTTDLSPEAPTVYCDRNQLENAVLNLVLNARDAMDGRGKLLLCSRPAQRAEIRSLGLSTGAFCSIEVKDSGPGIADAILPSVTEPFFTTKPVGEGSGLGLSMVKGFTEQSGGGMIITSRHSGTTVTMVLPSVAP